MMQQVESVVSGEEEAAAEQSKATETLQADCERELAVALPALEEAIAALKSLASADVVALKSLKNPPAPVKLVVEAVCILRV